MPLDLATVVSPPTPSSTPAPWSARNRKSPPSVFVCSEEFWGTLSKAKDLAGRPLIVSGWSGPQNARGIGNAIIYGHVAGQVVGLPGRALLGGRRRSSATW